MAATDLLMDHAAFDLWLTAQGGDNLADLERVKRVLPIVLEDYGEAVYPKLARLAEMEQD